MSNFLANKFLMISLGIGTAAGLAGAVGGRFVIESQVELPKEAELISLDGAVMEDGEASVPPPVPLASSKAARKGKRAWLEPIIRRNIFDSSKVGGVATEDSDDGTSGTKTALPLVLLATIVADPMEYSSALIMEEKGEDGSQGYGVGDSLLGEAVIHRIEPRVVILKRTDGTTEYLEMEGSTLVKREAKKGKKKGKWDGIEKESKNKFVVDEETFNKALENPEKLASSIRAVPHKGDDGQIDGYRLSGVRRSSLFNKLGIRNGDVVHTVNGNNLTSMQTAMEAYRSLQNERNFNFEITRRNKRQTFEYEVR
jgi:general secretion pathway protein C